MNDSKRSTKVNLLLSAERLIGEVGVRNVSMRQISEASGNKNIAAAQYHYGSLNNLIVALIEYRKASLDHLREHFYREMNTDFSYMSARDFMSLIIRPHMGLKDDNGVRAFARFLKSIQQDKIYYDLWHEHYHGAPFASAIYMGLRRTIPEIPDNVWGMRINAIGKFIIGLIVDYDERPETERLPETEFTAEVIGMATACLVSGRHA